MLIRTGAGTANVFTTSGGFQSQTHTINLTGNFKHIYMTVSKLSTVACSIDGVTQTVTAIGNAFGNINAEGNFHDPVITYTDQAAAIDNRGYTIVAW